METQKGKEKTEGGGSWRQVRRRQEGVGVEDTRGVGRRQKGWELETGEG